MDNKFSTVAVSLAGSKPNARKIVFKRVQVGAVPTEDEPKTPNPSSSSQRPSFPSVENEWGMTPIECEVMRLTVSEFLTIEEIGVRLCRATSTIASARERIKLRMKAKNHLQTALLWDRAMRSKTPPSGTP